MIESAAIDERAQRQNGLPATRAPSHAGALEPRAVSDTEPESDAHAPGRILILVDDLTVAVPTDRAGRPDARR